LDSAIRFQIIQEETQCFLKNLHPACRVKSGVEVHKRTDERAHNHVRFGEQALQVLQVRPKYEEKREAGGQGEFLVGLAARRDVASQPAT
jgi:hypothetical protein